MVSCDITAVRKIWCGTFLHWFLATDARKRANYENHQHNFAGMGRYGRIGLLPGFKRTSPKRTWLATVCNSDASRKRFVKQTGVRWSEHYSLALFDPIRFTIVDPMHCLFLGIAKMDCEANLGRSGILTSSMPQ
ncbi:unnamed protein product [Rhizophagus irregularis]|nr:unnamed protein product [Rhizophagus irregularis]